MKRVTSLLAVFFLVFQIAAWAPASATTPEGFAGGSAWVPIGKNVANNHFTGTFNGNSKTISGLNVTYNYTTAAKTNTNKNYIGLFGYTEGAIIRDLTVAGSFVEGTSNVGTIIGYADSSLMLSNCHVESGVVSKATNGSYYGGLVGYAPDDAKIHESSFSGSVSGNTYTGGIVGGIRLNDKTVNAPERPKFAVWRCSVTAPGIEKISGSAQVGGIAGYTNSGTNALPAAITNCYATGEIDAVSSANVGGILGNNLSAKATVDKCVVISQFVKQKTATRTNVNAISGDNKAVSSSNYYRGDLILQANGVTVPSTQGTAKPLSDLKTQATYEGLGWSFGSVWKMSSTYPVLFFFDNHTPQMPIFNPAAVTIAVGDTRRLTGTNLDLPTNTWSIADPTVASLNAAALEVTGESAGTTTVTVRTADGATATCTVMVGGEPPLSLAVTMYQDETLNLAAYIDGLERAVNWEVSEVSGSNVLSVDPLGMVTALSEGTAVVTAKAAGNSDTATVRIVVKPYTHVTGITFPDSTLNLEIGDMILLDYEILPADASNPRVIWVSSNPGVARAEDGFIRAVSSGFAAVTAITLDGNYSATVDVYVEYAVTGVEITPSGGEIIVGDTLQLTAASIPATSTAPEVLWSGSDDAVATVDPVTGLVTAIAPGTVTFSAELVGKSITGTAAFTVRNPITETLGLWNDFTGVNGASSMNANASYENRNAQLLSNGNLSLTVAASNSDQLNTTGWTSPHVNTRALVASIDTTGMKNIKLNSLQQANANSPKDFIIEYSLNYDSWTAVTAQYEIRPIGSATGIQKIFSGLLLPSECNNKSVVYIRWRCVSNVNPGSGGAVVGTAPGIFKNILFTGEH